MSLIKGMKREKIKAYNQQYHEAHKAEINARSIQWHKDHPEQSLEISRKYRRTEKGREGQRLRSAKHCDRLRTENPERWKFRNVQMVQRRKARLLSQLGEPFTYQQWWDKVAELGSKCTYCAKPFGADLRPTQDHIIPLTSGGMHDLSNIVPACHSCNARKGTQTLDVFMQSLAESRPLPT